MLLMVLVLSRVECLEDILKEFGEHGLKGATILDSKGMIHSLESFAELSFMASFRMILDPDREENKTVLMVMKEEKVPVAIDIVNKITGGLEQPDTGVLFTVPVLHTEGFGKKNDA